MVSSIQIMTATTVQSLPNGSMLTLPLGQKIPFGPDRFGPDIDPEATQSCSVIIIIVT
jgi:hypothetical protein